MLARKGIFEKPSISQVRKAHIGQSPKACEARFSANIISLFAFFIKLILLIPRNTVFIESDGYRGFGSNTR